MPVDPEYLREYFASLSDEALVEINREELVKTAQECTTTSSASGNWLRGQVSSARMDNTMLLGGRMRRRAPATNPTGWKKPLKFTLELTCPGRGRLLT